jgi:hypothetical protein
MRSENIIDKNEISEHPLIEELKRRLADCRSGLLDLLEIWHTMQFEVQPRLMFVYESIFGDLEVEIQRKQKIAQELERRVELLSIKLQRGETLTKRTIDFVNKIVDREFDPPKKNGKDAKISSKQYNHSKNISRRHDTMSFKKKQELIEVPKIYREIVKKLHPDVNGETETFKKYWDNIQAAYKTRNLQRLKLFKKTLCSDDINEIEVKAEERTIRKEVIDLELNINVEQRKIDRLKSQEPFSFENKLNDNIWIERRKRQLQDRIFHIEMQIKLHSRMLKSITGNEFESIMTRLREKGFGEEFLESTYFNQR